MPELPEVQTIVDDLRPHLLGASITLLRVHDPLIVRGISAKKIESGLKGAEIKDVYRRGKAIVTVLSPASFLVVQPIMTGQWVHYGSGHVPPVRKDTRITMILSNGGTVLYHDQRRFGQWHWVQDLAQLPYFQKLGPEPLTDDFTTEVFIRLCEKQQRPIKSVLLDHTRIAGIGNIYAAECLFRAKIHPARPAHSLQTTEATVLVKHIKEVLEEAIIHRGSSMRNYRDGRGEMGKFNALIRVYAREGEPCFVCREPIQRMVQNGRSTFFCPICQK